MRSVTNNFVSKTGEIVSAVMYDGRNYELMDNLIPMDKRNKVIEANKFQVGLTNQYGQDVLLENYDWVVVSSKGVEVLDEEEFKQLYTIREIKAG